MEWRQELGSNLWCYWWWTLVPGHLFCFHNKKTNSSVCVVCYPLYPPLPSLSLHYSCRALPTEEHKPAVHPHAGSLEVTWMSVCSPRCGLEQLRTWWAKSSCALVWDLDWFNALGQPRDEVLPPSVCVRAAADGGKLSCNSGGWKHHPCLMLFCSPQDLKEPEGISLPAHHGVIETQELHLGKEGLLTLRAELLALLYSGQKLFWLLEVFISIGSLRCVPAALFIPSPYSSQDPAGLIFL